MHGGCRTVIGSPVSQLPLGLPASQLIEQAMATPDAGRPMRHPNPKITATAPPVCPRNRRPRSSNGMHDVDTAISSWPTEAIWRRFPRADN